MEIWTIGYGAWPAADRARKMVEALTRRGVDRLVDVRLSPCAADIGAGRPYGPKAWSLQAGGAGLVGLLAEAGIAYEWAVELGNPQPRDPAMAVLRSHLADPDGGWPVHRGLARLAEAVRTPGAMIALLCACGDPKTCHRSLVADALSARHFGGRLVARDVRTGLTAAVNP